MIFLFKQVIFRFHVNFLGCIFGNTYIVCLKASGTGGGTAFNGTASEEDFDGTASSAASAIRLHVCH